MLNPMKYDLIRNIAGQVYENLFALHNAKTKEECKQIINIYSERIDKLGETFYKNDLATLQKIVNDTEYIKAFAKDMNEFHVFDENVKAAILSGRITIKDVAKMYNEKFPLSEANVVIDEYGISTLKEKNQNYNENEHYNGAVNLRRYLEKLEIT